MQTRIRFVDGSHIDVELPPIEIAEKLRNEREFVPIVDCEGREFVINPEHVLHISGQLPS